MTIALLFVYSADSVTACPVSHGSHTAAGYRADPNY
jgi:hypothetical protein